MDDVALANLANSNAQLNIVMVSCSVSRVSSLVMMLMVIVMFMDLFVVMHGRSFVDDGVEAIVLIGGVVNGANGTIGFHQRVLSLYGVTITSLVLGLDIAGVEIINAILESVFGRCIVIHVFVLMMMMILYLVVRMLMSMLLSQGNALNLVLMLMSIIMYGLSLMMGQMLIATMALLIVMMINRIGHAQAQS